MSSRYMGVFLVAASTLMAEVVLVRVFDVILLPNLAYLIVTAALFAFGLAGVYTTLRPLASDANGGRAIWGPSVILSMSLFGLLPVLNVLPFDYTRLPDAPLSQIAAFAGLYSALALPFFCAGLVLARLFASHATDIRRLYAWDLLGAACGSVAPLPLLASLGPGGLLMLSAALALAAAGLFAHGGARRGLVAAGTVVAAVAVFAGSSLELADHVDKRGLKRARELGLVERSLWDPVAKIDVLEPLPVPWDPDITDAPELRPRRHIVYDGGSQSSYFYGFSGNYAALRDSIERRLIPPEHHFWFWGVMASHHLKRDTGSRVLVIGSAGGQEIKAALMYGASHVDGVELVGAVTRLGMGEYAGYNGGVLLDPRVNPVWGEGRSFLRSASEPYDIIQIFSNHTTSSISQGTGAVMPDYLHTREAYREYFDHLDPLDGVLHVNHHLYPRILTTAAAAWAESRTGFERHVLVLERAAVTDFLPTILIKMSPWTEGEVAEMESLATLSPGSFRVVERPGSPADGVLPAALLEGGDSDDLDRAPYRLYPATDDRPYFSFTRKTLREVEIDESRMVGRSVAAFLNRPLRRGVPMDIVHLFVVAVVSMGLAALFVAVPLWRSGVGRARWSRKGTMLGYFAALGTGFIMIELALLQLLVKIVGFPLFTFALVIFTLLAGAGLGSGLSERLGVSPDRRWWWPFAGVLAYGIGFALAYETWSGWAIGLPGALRALAASAMIMPLGVVLGMPFPLGILWADRQPEGAVAWAWAMNGISTVIGGVGMVALALTLGLRTTFVIALGLYALAFLAFRHMRAA